MIQYLFMKVFIKGALLPALKGEEGKPVVICPYENDRVVFDNTSDDPKDYYRTHFSVSFQHIQLRGLIFTNSNENNRSSNKRGLFERFS